MGKPEALTDLYIYTYPSAGITGPYYQGTHTANYGKRSDKFDYLRNEYLGSCTWSMDVD